MELSRSHFAEHEVLRIQLARFTLRLSSAFGSVFTPHPRFMKMFRGSSAGPEKGSSPAQSSPKPSRPLQPTGGTPPPRVLARVPMSSRAGGNGCGQYPLLYRTIAQDR